MNADFPPALQKVTAAVRGDRSLLADCKMISVKDWFILLFQLSAKSIFRSPPYLSRSILSTPPPARPRRFVNYTF